ncbi:hypothetical protein MBLNU459_g3977t2 [Dothideomycetes sp. NU459]
MDRSYAPRSPDLSGYAPRSPELIPYRPQSPVLKHDPYAPRSPDLSSAQPYLAPQLSGSSTGFGLEEQHQQFALQQGHQWNQPAFPPQQQQAYSYLAQQPGGPPVPQDPYQQFGYHPPPQAQQHQQSQQLQHYGQPPPPQYFNDPHAIMPSQTRSSRNGNPSYAEDPNSDGPDFLPEHHAPAMAGTPGRRGRKPKNENGGAGGLNSAPPPLQKMDTGGVEVKTKFPTARIKRIMQADEDVGKVAQVTPVVVAKALELFMIRLISASAAVAKQRGSKRVLSQHMKAAVMQDEQFDNLRDIMGKVPDAPAKGSGGAAADDDDEDGGGGGGGEGPKKASRKKGGAEGKTPSKGKRRRDSED